MRHSKWLVVDVSCLAYRAMYTTGNLASGTEATGTLYGFLAEVQRLYSRFDSHQFAFCFDSVRGPWRRQRLYEPYKRNRIPTNDPVVEKAKQEMHLQIRKLKTTVLPQLGFQNLFEEDGYEADDAIACVTESLRLGDTAVIVSADKDLYQLLRTRRVVQFNPCWKVPLAGRVASCYTQFDLATEFEGIVPDQWASLKAIAGCHSDNVKGCVGVAEKSAAKYLTHRLSLHTGKYRAIESFLKSEEYATNLQLCSLPFRNYPSKVATPITENPFESGRWEGVVRELGFDSLVRPSKSVRGGIAKGKPLRSGDRIR